jgi:hypothetical protein
LHSIHLHVMDIDMCVHESMSGMNGRIRTEVPASNAAGSCVGCLYVVTYTGCSISHARVLRCSKPTNLLENETKFGIKKPLILLVFYAYFALFDVFLRKIQVLIFSLFYVFLLRFFLVFISCCVKVQCRFPALTKTRKMHYNEIFAVVLHFLNDLQGVEFKISFIST